MKTSLIDLFLVYTEGVTIAQVNEYAKEKACYKGQVSYSAGISLTKTITHCV